MKSALKRPHCKALARRAARQEAAALTVRASHEQQGQLLYLLNHRAAPRRLKIWLLLNIKRLSEIDALRWILRLAACPAAEPLLTLAN
ncbi:hypothetical protein Q5H92_21730 [Hymenobacter sp. M29]|uniref:Uncharacterized protein n=1 Tax=Hymenobacter mellowenesis TaxID=3063995 RepID=A0ABT9AGK7_9BACT|nr:hypothetical protein [Hymenobacter sp. M29]MDO7849000.1 hypothetical protein [Hymenobacter sp. M29]